MKQNRQSKGFHTWFGQKIKFQQFDSLQGPMREYRKRCARTHTLHTVEVLMSRDAQLKILDIQVQYSTLQYSRTSLRDFFDAAAMGLGMVRLGLMLKRHQAHKISHHEKHLGD